MTRRVLGLLSTCLLVPLLLLGATQAGEERFDYDPLGRLIRVIDEQNRVTEYVYDPAGNLLQVITDGTVTPPTISGISPDALRRGESKQVVVTGSALTGVRVSTEDPGLSISDTTISPNQIRFTLAASNTAVLGPQPITFANSAGTTTAGVVVNPILPKVNVAPAPLAIPPDGASRQFAVRLSNPDNVDHSFALSVSDATVITISPASVTIPAGQTEIKANLIGLKGGLATITLTSATLGTTQAPVFVTAEFKGINTSYAPLVGVVVEQPPQPKPPQTITPFGAPHVGVVVGGYVYSVSPKALVAGTGPTDVVIYGKGLQGVTAVTAQPANGLTLGAPVPNADGTSVTVPVTVEANAPMTLRQLIVQAGTQAVPPSSPEADRLLIAPPAPEIISIEPLFVLPGTPSQTLLVRGRNFRNVQGVTVTPNAGIVVGTQPALNAEGTEMTLKLAISPIAEVGPRTVVITTASGSSTATALPSNTFAVVNEVKETYTPITAAVVGVVKEQTPPPPPTQSIGLTASQVGIAVGSVVTGLEPQAGSIGETFTLTIQGFELQNVTAVNFVPNTGVTVGSITIAPDGRSLTAPVTLAIDAPLTLRAVQVVAGTAAVPPAPVAATQFRVTTPTPEVHSVSPNFVQLGAPAGTYTIRGKNFHNAQQVKILPPDGVTVSAPTVNSSATEITVTLSAAANAVKGKRTVVVVTPVGETSSTQVPANTLILANDAETVTPVVAPHVGVVLEQPAQPISTPIGPIASPIVGVTVQTPAPPPATTDIFLTGTRVGVTVGPVAMQAAPAGLARGASGTLTIQGQALNAVTAVALQPATGITLGTLTASADGTELAIPITVTADAPTGLREIVLTGAPFSDAAAGRFYIATGEPQIESISPILANQGTTVTLLIRGAHLQATSSITANPADGLVFGSTMTINAAGTELSIPLHVPADAALGPRVIRVITPAGTTTADAIPANTFTVYPP